jgi:large subunit ribosomal protein L33
MAKGKDIRITVILECTSCDKKSVNKESRGISRYITQKNRHNTPSRLELKKICPFCRKHMFHAEIHTSYTHIKFEIKPLWDIV